MLAYCHGIFAPGGGGGGRHRARSGHAAAQRNASASLLKTGHSKELNTLVPLTRCRRLGREGRMEALLCPESNFPSQNISARPGTRGDWSVRSAHCCQSRFGPFARASNWQATSRSGAVQPRDRQQAARVRSRSTQSRRPRDRRSRPRTCLVVQSKTGRPVQFEVSENTRNSVLEWVNTPEMHGCVLLFPSRFHASPHLLTRQSPGWSETGYR